MRIVAVFLVTILAFNSAFADLFTEKARSALTDIALYCSEGSVAGYDHPSFRPCSDAMERWRLLPADDREPAFDGLVEEMVEARREAVTLMLSPPTDKRARAEARSRIVAAAEFWTEAVLTIRGALRG